jgi:hypothetical protein
MDICHDGRFDAEIQVGPPIGHAWDRDSIKQMHCRFAAWNHDLESHGRRSRQNRFGHRDGCLRRISLRQWRRWRTTSTEHGGNAFGCSYVWRVAGESISEDSYNRHFNERLVSPGLARIYGTGDPFFADTWEWYARRRAVSGLKARLALGAGKWTAAEGLRAF